MSAVEVAAGPPTGGAFRLAADAPFRPFGFGALRIICDVASVGATRLLMLEGEFAPGQGDPFHFHPEQEEIIHVLEGRVEQWLGRERRILGPGDATFVPPGVIHGAWNAGETPARLLAIFGPAIEGGIGRVDVAAEAPWSALRA
jgi:quercetin dioxygenase-like cupin family protein